MKTAEFSLESRVQANRCPCLTPALVAWTRPGRGLLMLIQVTRLSEHAPSLTAPASPSPLTYR